MIANIQEHPFMSHAVRGYNSSRGEFSNIFIGNNGDIRYYVENVDLNKNNDIYLAGAFAT